MLIERLKEKFEIDEPIFLQEILEVMNDYSRQRVYQLIDEELKNQNLMRFSRGVYYIPEMTVVGLSTTTVDEVIHKQYIGYKDEVYGIYGRGFIDLYFLVCYQLPFTIEMISNKATKSVRKKILRGRPIVIRKPRVPITKENESAYTLLELFTHLNPKQYEEEKFVRDSISEYIEEKKLNTKMITSIANAFPKKALTDLISTGVFDEIKRKQTIV